MCFSFLYTLHSVCGFPGFSPKEVTSIVLTTVLGAGNPEVHPWYPLTWVNSVPILVKIHAHLSTPFPKPWPLSEKTQSYTSVSLTFNLPLLVLGVSQPGSATGFKSE